MAEKRAVCPECGKEMKWRGLNGHLRFEHRMDTEKAREVSRTVEPFEVEDEQDRDERILAVLERIDERLHGDDDNQHEQPVDDQVAPVNGQEEPPPLQVLSVEALVVQALERISGLQGRLRLVEAAEESNTISREMALPIKQLLVEEIDELEENLTELRGVEEEPEEEEGWFDSFFTW